MNDSDKSGQARPEEIFERPDLFLWQIDGPAALFVKMDRNTYYNSIFCDQRIFPASPEILRMDFSRLHDYFSERPADPLKLNFIFHIAHCGSTLLARALDIKESNIVYREPAVLRQLGSEAASSFYGATAPLEWQQKLAVALAMLNRSYTKEGPVIIKANVPVNFMLPEILESSQVHQSIFLYLSLENYLLAVLKTPNHRSWVAAVSTELGAAIESVTGITPEQRQSMSIPETAACLWLAQIAIFDQALRDKANARSLDAETFYNDPENTLQKIFGFFEQAVSASDISDIVNSDLFTRYSKNPNQIYDNDTRLAQRDAIKDQLSGDLDKGREWIARHSEKCGITSALSKPLMETASSLLD